MKKFVIHLPEQRERLKTLTYEMNRFYLDYTICPGVKMDVGSKGISESFKRVIRDNINEEKILIFEDDVKFTSDKSLVRFFECMESLPDNWDILLGGSYWYEEEVKLGNLIKVKDFCSLHCVLIRKSAYEAFLSHSGQVKDIDRYLGKLSCEGKLNVYLCDPMIAVQYNGFSFNRNNTVNYDSLLRKFNILR
jgi:GR25 family glycosyltransferase involved in LPS biosynthesis